MSTICPATFVETITIVVAWRTKWLFNLFMATNMLSFKVHEHLTMFTKHWRQPLLDTSLNGIIEAIVEQLIVRGNFLGSNLTDALK